MGSVEMESEVDLDGIIEWCIATYGIDLRQNPFEDRLERFLRGGRAGDLEVSAMTAQGFLRKAHRSYFATEFAEFVLARQGMHFFKGGFTHSFWTQVPQLFGRIKTSPITIWCPACYQGDIVYSILMLAKEHGHQIQAIGSNVSPIALEEARQGVYSLTRLQHVPNTFSKYFEEIHPEEDGYQIIPDIRAQVQFWQCNLIECLDDFPMVDIIFVGHTFHYFTDEWKHKLMEAFKSKAKFILNAVGLIECGNGSNFRNCHSTG